MQSRLDGSSNKPRIGYVGIGLMGLPMVRRLLERGYPVTVHDIVDDRSRLAEAAGATVAASAAEVVPDADLVLLNLPTTDAVGEAVFAATAGRFFHREGRQGTGLRRQAPGGNGLRLDRCAGLRRATRLRCRHADCHGRR